MAKRKRRPGLGRVATGAPAEPAPREAPADGPAAANRAWGTRMVREPDGTLARKRVHLGESPLQLLARRTDARGLPLIDAVELEAGERLREDFTRARMMPRMTVDWSRPTSGGGHAPGALHTSEAVAAASVRVRRALALLGPGLSDAALSVCCHLEGLETVERSQGWPARSGRTVLRLALARLADFYGIAGDHTPKDARQSPPRGRSPVAESRQTRP